MRLSTSQLICLAEAGLSGTPCVLRGNRRHFQHRDGQKIDILVQLGYLRVIRAGSEDGNVAFTDLGRRALIEALGGLDG